MQIMVTHQSSQYASTTTHSQNASLSFFEKNKDKGNTENFETTPCWLPKLVVYFQGHIAKINQMAEQKLPLQPQLLPILYIIWEAVVHLTVWKKTKPKEKWNNAATSPSEQPSLQNFSCENTPQTNFRSNWFFNPKTKYRAPWYSPVFHSLLSYFC